MIRQPALNSTLLSSHRRRGVTMTEVLIAIMILGIGLRFMDVKPIRVGSLLPGLVVAPVLVALFAR